MTQKDMCIIDY